MDLKQENLTFALPSKGRLYDQTITFLRETGFDVQRAGNGRGYVARLMGIDNVDIIFLRPDEIPERIEHAGAHIGITGEDLYKEFRRDKSQSFPLMPNLGFGAARLVVAVPQSWIDVSTMSDLDEVAMLYHQQRGSSLRVATKFSRLTRAFFAESGIVEYRLVESLGATEGAPTAGVADIIVDLTSTGTTLSENHLKEITGGTVLKSEACIIASLDKALWTKGALRALEQIVEQIESRKRASTYFVLRFSIPSDKSVHVREWMTVKFKCKITSWQANMVLDNGSNDEARDFLNVLCDREKLHSVIRFLRPLNSSAIVVDRSEFIFYGSSDTFSKFRQALKRRDDDAEATAV